MYTKEELITALLNLQWILKNREDVGFDAETETVIDGSGGAALNMLIVKGYTPATR